MAMISRWQGIARRHAIALAVAGGWALLVPILMLQPGLVATPAPRSIEPPLAPAPQPLLAAAYRRALFAPAGGMEDAAPADAPQLIGIVGRIDRDAVALVRTADGTSRTLAVGASIDGWRLASLAIDAAFFTRGGERVRVPLPAGDDAAPEDQ